MTRDMELIRKLLLYFDQKPGSEHVEVTPIPWYDDSIIKYHLVLLYDAGLLRCEPVKSTSGDRIIYVLPFDLTWAGHEFLDKIRSLHIWDEVKTRIKKKGFPSASIDLIKQIADSAIRRKLDLD